MMAVIIEILFWGAVKGDGEKREEGRVEVRAQLAKVNSVTVFGNTSELRPALLL